MRQERLTEKVNKESNLALDNVLVAHKYCVTRQGACVL